MDPVLFVQQFKDAMAKLAAGVSVISASTPEGFRGLTATSLTAVSAQPPLLLVALEAHTVTLEAVAATGRFSASVLDRKHEFWADRFSGRAPQVDPLWREVAHRIGDNGLPIVEGSVAWFECEVDRIVEAGDHSIVLGRVASAGSGPGEPLVLWDRAFRRVG